MKKFLAVLLSLLTMFTLLTPAFAAEEETPPLVIVRGMQFTGQYTDLGTENEHPYLERISAGNIAVAVIKALVNAIVSHSRDAFADSMIESLLWMFEEMACDADGNSIYDVSPVVYPGAFSQYIDSADLGDGGEDALLAAACERYGAENVYYFVYDWRLDPYDVAEDIYDTVEQAKAEHQADKVNVIACSMGGVMLNAYMYRYGYESINSCVHLSSTFQGTYCTTDLFQGKAVLNSPALSFLLQNQTGGALPSSIINAVSSVAGMLCNLFIDEFKGDIYEGFMRSTFATIPSLWAVTLPDELESCIDYVFPTVALQEEYSGVIARARRMGEINAQTDQMLLRAQADGCKISVVASYNGSCVPFYARADVHGDGTLESPLMLGGATMAPVGETLAESYAAAEPACLSPDRILDMSTALFLENTWALKGAPHVPSRVGSDVTEFLFALIESDAQPTVSNMTGYTQFMQADSELQLQPVTA